MVLLCSCATAGATSQVFIGQERGGVQAALGPPDSISAKGGVEYWNYRLVEDMRDIEFFVRIIDNKVESFGKKGDFDSTQPVTTRVQFESTDRTPTHREDRLDVLKKLYELRQSGALTEEEYQTQKARILAP